MTGSIIMPGNDNFGIFPASNNYGTIGSLDKKFYKMYASTFHGTLDGNASSATNANIAESLSSSAGEISRPVYFLNGKPVACNDISIVIPGNLSSTSSSLTPSSVGIIGDGVYCYFTSTYGPPITIPYGVYSVSINFTNGSRMTVNYNYPETGGLKDLTSNWSGVGNYSVTGVTNELISNGNIRRLLFRIPNIYTDGYEPSSVQISYRTGTPDIVTTGSEILSRLEAVEAKLATL